MTLRTFLAAALLVAVSLPASAQINLGGTVLNVTPTLTSVTVSGSYNPTSGTTTAVPVSTVVTDTNGCADLSVGGTVTAAVYDNSDNLVVSPAALTYGSCSLGVAATYSGNVLMPFHAAAGTYKVRISATDQASANVLGSLLTAPTFTYTSLVAASVPGSFSFGTTLTPGAATAAGAGVAITNTGNAQIDTQVSGTALTLASPAASIAVGSIAYSLNNDMSSSSALSGTPTTVSSFDLGAGASSSKTLYLQLTVPSAASQYLPAGAYTGTLTVTAISS